MKTLLTILICLTLFSCESYGPDYTYKWKTNVTYTNGDKDTINCKGTSFNGNEVRLYLSTGDMPCLRINVGVYDSPIVCGVRRYDIISLEKIPVK